MNENNKPNDTEGVISWSQDVGRVGIKLQVDRGVIKLLYYSSLIFL